MIKKALTYAHPKDDSLFVARSVYSAIKLSNKFNIRLRTTKYNLHATYYVECPEDYCSKAYLGEKLHTLGRSYKPH